MMVETQLADKFRMLGAASPDPFAYIQNHQTIAPVSEISEPILDLQIVEVTADNFPIATGRGYHCGHLTGNFPPRHFLRILHIGKVDNAHGTCGIVGQVNKMTVNKSAVYSARHRLG